jgi:hypothetical protein
VPLRNARALAEALEDRVFGRMHVEAVAQRLVGGTNSRRLVDADLLGNGQVQREVQKGIHLPVLGRELLLDRRRRVFEQRVVLGVMDDQVGGGHFGAFEDRALTVLSPGFAEELPDLLTAGIEHRPPWSMG